jgi:hypothetical protein
MSAVGRAIDKALSREEVPPADIEGLERLRAVLALTGKRLAGVDPQLVPPAPLDTIAGALSSARTDLDNYASDGDANRVAAANTHADQVLTALPLVVYPFVADDFIALRDAALEHRSTVERAARQADHAVVELRAKIASVVNEVSNITALIAAEQTKLGSLATEFKTTFSSSESARDEESKNRIRQATEKLDADVAAVATRLNDLSNLIDGERTRLTTLGTEFQGQFATAQRERSTDFETIKKNQQDRFDAMLAEYVRRLDEQEALFAAERAERMRLHTEAGDTLREKYEADAEGILETIRKHLADVEKVTGVIGNVAVTSGYQRAANEAWWRMLAWQVIAVFAMVAVIVFAYLAFLPFTDRPFSWQQFAGKLVLAVSVGALAAYAAAQGDRAAERERRNRKLALELEAIGPYLAPLSEDKQHAFRVELGNRTFGMDDEPAYRLRRRDRSPANVIDAALRSPQVREALADFLRNFPGKP